MGKLTSVVGSKHELLKVGEYITNDSSVFLRVVAVITENTVMPIYGLISPKKADHIQWQTEFEVYEHDRFHKQTPDFAKYQMLKPGDRIKMGSSKDREDLYMQILARVGDSVLISAAPDKQNGKKISSMLNQIEELTDGEIKADEVLTDENKEHLRHQGSLSFTNKVAAHWETVDQVCLMNWPIVGDE